MHFGLVTLFPDAVVSLLELGVTGTALKNGLATLATSNPRDFCTDAHRTVDDRPFGGGPGMVMKLAPLEAAIDSALENAPAGTKTVLLSPQGRRFDQRLAADTARSSGLILVCGRYEGVDERLVTRRIDEEWSIGDYVLSGGELAALVIMDAVVRLVPGALGHPQSAERDSYVEGLLDHPHYTRPENYDGAIVPPVLLSGDHAAIRRWRLKQALGRTLERRPRLLEERQLSDEERKLLAEYQRERDQTG